MLHPCRKRASLIGEGVVEFKLDAAVARAKFACKAPLCPGAVSVVGDEPDER